jgi:hypothetical protein
MSRQPSWCPAVMPSTCDVGAVFCCTEGKAGIQRSHTYIIKPPSGGGSVRRIRLYRRRTGRRYRSQENTICGLDEQLRTCFSKSSTAMSLSCTAIIVWPKTVIELRGPYWSLYWSQCSHSGVPAGGRSDMFPTSGRPLGPGGSGSLALRPPTIFWMRYAVKASATPHARRS